MDSFYCVCRQRSAICDKSLNIYEPFRVYESDLLSDGATFIKMSMSRDPGSAKYSSGFIVGKSFPVLSLVTCDHLNCRLVMSVIL